MLYQFLPRLSDDEYAALEQSIRVHGVQVPVLVDENGSVIDGHHRREIADRLDIAYPCKRAVGLTDEQKRTLALSLNIDRRHLGRKQKRKLVEQSLKADPQLSDRQHAERTGVSPTTAGKARADLEQSGRLSKLDSRTSADGRQRPASYTRPAPQSASGGETGPDASASDYPAPAEARPQNTSPTIPQGEPVSRAVGEASAPVSSLPPTGGDTGPVPAPAPASVKSRRRPLPDAFWTALHDLSRQAETHHRLTQDDRWPTNAEQLATGRNRNELHRINDLIHQVINSLPAQEPTP